MILKDPCQDLQTSLKALVKILYGKDVRRSLKIFQRSIRDSARILVVKDLHQVFEDLEDL